MNNTRKSILAISGSTRIRSANGEILKAIATMAVESLDIHIFEGIAELPHFNPDADGDGIPASVQNFRTLIEQADGVLICTPEYVFSLPGTLKNALEWTVATTVFLGKPTALITASSSGEKAHESLRLVMKTLGGITPDESALLIQGVRQKVDSNGTITDAETLHKVQQLLHSFTQTLYAASEGKAQTAS